MKKKNIYIVCFLLFAIILTLILYKRNIEPYNFPYNDLPYNDLDNDIEKRNTLESFRTLPVYFINLKESEKRRKAVLKEFEKLGMKTERIDAVKYSPGNIGCSLSHIKAIETAKAAKHKFVIICEDDIEFLFSPDQIHAQMDQFLKTHRDWDMILLSTSILDATYIGNGCIQVHSSVESTGYIVRSEYYNVLLQNFRVHVERLKAAKGSDEYAIDVGWNKLQKRDKWYLPYPLISRQKMYTLSTIRHHGIKITNPENDIKNVKNLPKDEQSNS